MRPDLIAAHRDNPKLAPFLHLPVQAGSDRILKRMNRQHTADDYLEIIADARRARPDLAISSDFIVGFPEETDADFEQTLELVETVGFASAYAFKYSERPGTPAAERGGQVEEAVKTQRLAALQRALDRQRFAFNDALRRHDVRRAVGAKGPPPRTIHRPFALYAKRPGRRRRPPSKGPAFA